MSAESAQSGLSNQCGSCSEVNVRVENIKRQNLLSNLVLDGLPPLQTGNQREDLLSIVVAIGRLVAVNVKCDDVSKIYRISSKSGVNSSTTCRPVIIHFRDRSTWDQLYRAYLKNHNLMLSDLLP